MQSTYALTVQSTSNSFLLHFSPMFALAHCMPSRPLPHPFSHPPSSPVLPFLPPSSAWSEGPSPSDWSEADSSGAMTAGWGQNEGGGGGGGGGGVGGRGGGAGGGGGVKPTWNARPDSWSPVGGKVSPKVCMELNWHMASF